MKDRKRAPWRVIATLAALACTLVLLLEPGAANRKTGQPTGDMWQPHWLQRHMWGVPDADPEMLARLNRHYTFMHVGIPEEYIDAESGIETSDATVASGGRLYVTHCAECHGTDGLGDDVAAQSLSPSPALLRHMIEHPVSVDQYLLWTISEGGVDFETDMPAFKNKLDREQIWKIIAYMRAGFPDIEN